MKKALFALAILLLLPVVALASEAAKSDEMKPATKSEVITLKATIEAIDKTARMITLKDDEGNTETLVVGPEVKRFDELKVGDKVTFRYTESIVVKIQKPGEAVKSASAGSESVVRGEGPKPSGAIMTEQTATVTIKAIDAKASSVTFQTEAGRTLSIRVREPKMLEGIKVGDKVEITYKESLAVSVE